MNLAGENNFNGFIRLQAVLAVAGKMKFAIIFLALALSCEGTIVQTQYGPIEGAFVV